MDETSKATKRGEAAVSNPKAAFASPMEVVRTPALKPAEKRKALETWEEDEKALQRATEEGMGGGERPHLREVKKAEQALEKKDRHEGS